MKMLCFTLACCGFVVLTFGWGLLGGVLDSSAAGGISAGGCYQTITPGETTPGTWVLKGTAESPQRCYLDTDCRYYTECSEDAAANYIHYVSWIYVGSCEVAQCPETARCHVCQNLLVCAVYEVYATAGDCQARQNLLTTGISANTNKDCDGSEGT